MDVKDGISWSKLKIMSNEFTAVFHPLPHPSNHTVILGNAYLSLYFTNQQDSKILKQCISAYSQAVCIQIPQAHGQSCTERVQSCLEVQSVSTQRLCSSRETAQSVKKILIITFHHQQELSKQLHGLHCIVTAFCALHEFLLISATTRSYLLYVYSIVT